MRRVRVNQCSAVLKTVCDVIFNNEKDSYAISAIIRLMMAILVLDQLEPLPSYCLLPKIITILDESTL